MIIDRIRILWSGFPGGPGVSTMYWETTETTALTAIRTFFNSIADRLPNNVTLTFPNSGDKIEDSTGEIVGTWSRTAVATVAGTGNTVYAAPVGVMVNWLTATIVAGRRLRGRTFIVPCIGQETASGVPDAALVADVQAAAGVLIAASPSMRIWHRPNNPPANDNGTNGLVTAAVVPTKFMVMRSRRD